MKLAVLAASGRTGHEISKRALERGHSVIALVRDPARLHIAASAQLSVAVANVYDPASIARAIDGADVVLSGLGVSRGEAAGALTAGARALIAAAPKRIVWLGAYGTGPSAQAAGWATRTLLKLMGARLPDKIEADSLIVRAGGTVVHAGPLSNGPLSQARRLIRVAETPHTFFASGVSRASVAALMVAEAESAKFAGGTAVALEISDPTAHQAPREETLHDK